MWLFLLLNKNTDAEFKNNNNKKGSPIFYVLYNDIKESRILSAEFFMHTKPEYMCSTGVKKALFDNHSDTVLQEPWGILVKS